MENQGKKAYVLQSVDRALQILCLFSEQKPEFTLTEVSRSMGMPNPVTFKYLNTLEQHGFITRDKNSKRYELGLTILMLSGIVRKNNMIRKVSYPVMQELAEIVGESIYLQVPVLSTYEAAVLEMVETQKTIIPRFLNSCKLYAGASRKVLLAYLGKDYIEKFFKSVKMEPYTEDTPIDPEKLKKELQEIRQQGYATSYGETIQEACGIASPIFDKDGITASLMIYVPSYRLNEEILHFHLKHLLKASKKISGLLNHDQ